MDAQDEHANFRAEVEAYTKADPSPAFQKLSSLTGIPVETLIRYVLVKWAASGSEALMAMRPIVFQQMQERIARAETDGTDAAKLRAYEALRQIVAWLGAESTGVKDEDHVEDQENDSGGA